MKQYLSPDQTAKLIELGFEKPKSIVSVQISWTQQEHRRNTAYSIGELLSFLPKEIDCNGFKNILYIFVNQGAWKVKYFDFLGEVYSTFRSELIDAIFDMCVKLKEEGVI